MQVTKSIQGEGIIHRGEYQEMRLIGGHFRQGLPSMSGVRGVFGQDGGEG